MLRTKVKKKQLQIPSHRAPRTHSKYLQNSPMRRSKSIHKASLTTWGGLNRSVFDNSPKLKSHSDQIGSLWRDKGHLERP